jgi:hypothetical protein
MSKLPRSARAKAPVVSVVQTAVDMTGDHVGTDQDVAVNPDITALQDKSAIHALSNSAAVARAELELQIQQAVARVVDVSDEHARDVIERNLDLARLVADHAIDPSDILEIACSEQPRLRDKLMAPGEPKKDGTPTWKQSPDGNKVVALAKVAPIYPDLVSEMDEIIDDNGGKGAIYRPQSIAKAVVKANKLNKDKKPTEMEIPSLETLQQSLVFRGGKKNPYVVTEPKPIDCEALKEKLGEILGTLQNAADAGQEIEGLEQLEDAISGLVVPAKEKKKSAKDQLAEQDAKIAKIKSLTAEGKFDELAAFLAA